MKNPGILAGPTLMVLAGVAVLLSRPILRHELLNETLLTGLLLYVGLLLIFFGLIAAVVALVKDRGA